MGRKAMRSLKREKQNEKNNLGGSSGSYRGRDGDR